MQKTGDFTNRKLEIDFFKSNMLLEDHMIYPQKCKGFIKTQSQMRNEFCKVDLFFYRVDITSYDTQISELCSDNWRDVTIRYLADFLEIVYTVPFIQV